MPVTRSATRAAKQRDEANAVKKTTPKTNAKEPHPSASGRGQRPPQNHSFLEWISLKTRPMTPFLTATNCFLLYKRCTAWKDVGRLREGVLMS